MQLLLVFLVIFVTASRTVPLSMVINSPGIVIPNGIDDSSNDEDDDFTTHTLERLSSAATCLVAGVEYTHGQQIYRKDPCEFCLCLDGEMFCWWQDCPPAVEGPCKDRGPFTPCQNGLTSTTDDKTTQKTTVSISVATTKSATLTAATSSTSSPRTDATRETTPSTTFEAHAEKVTTATASPASTNTDAPKICIVMGRQYKVGERLPHDTGNCVECVCGVGAQITCSPHQCGPSSDADDINDYRPPGLRSAQDVF